MLKGEFGWVHTLLILVAILLLSSPHHNTVGKENASVTTSQVALPGCPEKCGNVKIPYPFGIGDKCHYSHPEDGPFYNITCVSIDDDGSIFIPKYVDMHGRGEVKRITLDGEFWVNNYISILCYDGNVPTSSIYTIDNHITRFAISTTQNIAGAIGCDTTATFSGTRMISNSQFQSGCTTGCSNQSDVSNKCEGIGCCLISIPDGVSNITFEAGAISNHTNVQKFNPCSVAFVVAKDEIKGHNELPFSISSVLSRDFSNLSDLSFIDGLSMIYYWSIGTKDCKSVLAAKEKLLCKGNSVCVDRLPGLWGYRCQCKPGFQGNPYLNDCQDIDECTESRLNNCETQEYCYNFPGSYNCTCPEGYLGKATKDDPCIITISHQNDLIHAIVVGLGVFFGSILLLVFGWWLHSMAKKSKAIKQRKLNFERNGGILLQQQMTYDEGAVERIKIFKMDELKKATDHFNEDRILGQGGHGTVYKGMLGEGRIIAVKKSNKLEEGQREEFINEVVIMSQINHRNILKLLGCCLETDVPLLVYEFIPNGTLFHHIHNPSEDFPITWKMRLQIASDSAGALAYLHSSTSTLIFHRDIKSSNILLDDKYRAKLSDFGTSRSVAIDQTHVVTRVMGTFGYMDPEYFQSHQFTEKSDVYSFGVVLVELLTGQKAVRAASEEDRSLTSWFLSHMENSCVLDIIDSQILPEGSKEEFLAIADLAKRCLSLDGKRRPTMKEVLLEIEGILSLHVPQKNDLVKPKIEQVFVGASKSVSSSQLSQFSMESRALDSTELSLSSNSR